MPAPRFVPHPARSGPRRARRRAVAGAVLVGFVGLLAAGCASDPPAGSGGSAATTPDTGSPAAATGGVVGTAVPAAVPLPDGLSVVLPAPGDVIEAGHGGGVGTQTTVVADADGQPVVIWSSFDDATGASSTIRAAAYDPAAGGWTRPVELFSGRLGPGTAGRSLAATTDPTTGAIHAVWVHGPDEAGPRDTISLATSLDGGRTWTRQRVAEETGVATPAVAVADDVAHVTWWSERDGAVRATGPAPAEPGAERRWEREIAPVPDGLVAVSSAPAIAVDPTGAPVIAYVAATPAGGLTRVLLWRPDRSATPVAVADLPQSDPPAVALALHGDAPVLAIAGDMVEVPSPGTTGATGTVPDPTNGSRGPLDAPHPWAWVVRVDPTGTPGPPTAVQAGPAGLRTDDVPLPPGLGLTVLGDGTAAVALVPVTASTTCVVARQGPGGEDRGYAACSRGTGENQPQVVPSGRAPAIAALGGSRVAVPLGNSRAGVGLPVGVVLWTAG